MYQNVNRRLIIKSRNEEDCKVWFDYKAVKTLILSLGVSVFFDWLAISLFVVYQLRASDDYGVARNAMIQIITELECLHWVIQPMHFWARRNLMSQVHRKSVSMEAALSPPLVMLSKSKPSAGARQISNLPSNSVEIPKPANGGDTFLMI
jgi:hypothetical protein